MSNNYCKIYSTNLMFFSEFLCDLILSQLEKTFVQIIFVDLRLLISKYLFDSVSVNYKVFNYL